MIDGAATVSGAGSVLQARQLGKLYGAYAALDGIDLDLGPGERVLLLGHNGAGKSTLLRAAAGLIRPTSGTLRLWGADTLHGDREALRRRLGLLSHQSFLYDHLTAAENLIFYGRLYGLPASPDEARRALGEVGLDDRADDAVRTFSRGMQQRVAIARAMLHSPDLLLLDEPFTGLDRQGAETLQTMLGARLGTGRSFMMATHDFAAALPLATRVVVLAAGRIALDRTAAGIDPAGLDALYRQATAGGAPRVPA